MADAIGTMRVVTLLPSATELVFALGVEPVAVSHECDWPPAARERPRVVRSRLDGATDSAAIDRQVLEAERAGGVYELDLDALRAADPDLVITQGVCDVCAVDTVLVREAIVDLGLDCEVLTTDPHSLADVFADVERVGAALGREERADALLADLRGRVERVRERVPDAGHAGPEERPDRPRVAVLDWTDPVMTAGHWVPDLVAAAGGRYVLEAEASVPREWAELRDCDPDVLVVAPCGFDLAQTAANIGDLTGREGWDDLTAVRESRVYAVDGNHYLNRPGPRLVDSVEILAGLFHPSAFETPPEDAARPLSALADGDAGTGSGAGSGDLQA